MRYIFWSLFSHLFCKGAIVELHYYFVLFIIERRTRLRTGCVGRDNRSGLQFRESLYCCALLFEDCEFVVYIIIMLKLLLCQRLYVFQLLPHLCWSWTLIYWFRVFNANTYNLFHLFDGYFATSSNLFLHGF